MQPRSPNHQRKCNLRSAMVDRKVLGAWSASLSRANGFLVRAATRRGRGNKALPGFNNRANRIVATALILFLRAVNLAMVIADLGHRGRYL
jgi:hypothetical protein